MESNRKNIDDLFKDELGSYTEAPPPAVWDALEKRLDKKDRPGFLFRPWYFAVLTIAIFAGIVIARETSNSVAVEALPAHGTGHTSAATTDQAVSKSEPKESPKTDLITPEHTNNTIKQSSNHHIAHSQTTNIYNAAPVVTPRNTKIGNNAQPADENVARASNINQAASSENAQPVADNNELVHYAAYIEVASKKHHIAVTETQLEKPVQIISPNNTTPDDENVALAKEQATTGIKNLQVAYYPPVPANAPIASKKSISSQGAGYAIAAPKSGPLTPALAHEPVSANAGTSQKERKATKTKNNTDPVIAAAGTAPVNETMAKAHKTNAVNVAATNKNNVEHIITDETRSAGNTKTNTGGIAATAVAVNKPNAANITKQIGHAKHTEKLVEKVQANKQTIPIANKKATHRNQQKAQPANIPVAAAQSKKQPLQKTKTITPASTNIYAGSIVIPAANSLPFDNMLMPSASHDQRPISGTFRENSTMAIIPAAPLNISMSQPADTTKHSRRFGNFEAGIKAGYEGGFANGAAKKGVISPYLKYNLTPKFSIMTQPAIKAAHINNVALSGTQSFYKINNDGKYTYDSTALIIINPPYGTDTIAWQRDYKYTQSHDSVVKSYAYGGTYIEFELPILANYKVTRNLSLYGGLNLSYSKLAAISEKTYTSDPIVQTGAASVITPVSVAALPPAISSVINYQGASITSYKGPLYASQPGLFRVGYMLGASYEFNKKYLLDVLVQQSGTSQNVQGGYDVNKPLSTMYFRVTVGYKFGK